MELTQFLDPTAAVLVAGGTVLATAARAGFGACRVTAGQVAMLARPRFDMPALRAQLARPVARLHQDGILRFSPGDLDDSDFAKAVAGLCRYRSVAAFRAEHEAGKAARQKPRNQAIGTLEQAAELAPLFGLAGTLTSLAQSTSAGVIDPQSGIVEAVSLAVVSTLYGLLFAHFVILPLAGGVARRGEAEEADRAALTDWLAREAKPVCPLNAEQKDESFSTKAAA